MRTIWILLLSLSTLSGCANTSFGRADLAKRAKTEMIGMSKKELLSCAGVPARSEKIDDLEFLTYNSGGGSVGYIPGGSDSNAGGGAISIDETYCEATFVLENGKVNKVSYSGSTGGFLTKDEQCAFVIKNCLQSN
ncbi:MAG TPA: hypothetical protein VMW07_08590 [Gallionella sp.]|nr:hypothetical protein [Gallionella sp.]